MPSVRAQDDDASSAPDEYEEEVVEESSEPTEQPQQMYVMPAQDVATWVRFLGVEDNKFIAGNEVTALIGMHNSGTKTYNVSYVGAHLHSPYDQNFYVQNMTVRWTSSLLPPHSEVTIEYRFRPDEKLEPLPFLLSGWLIYNDSTVPTPIIYRSLFVNTTVEVLEKRAEWTVASTITWLFTIAGLSLAAYVVVQNTNILGAVTGASGKKGKSRPSASPSADEPSAGGASSGWDVKVYKPTNVQKAFGSKKMQKPKDK